MKERLRRDRWRGLPLVARRDPDSFPAVAQTAPPDRQGPAPIITIVPATADTVPLGVYFQQAS